MRSTLLVLLLCVFLSLSFATGCEASFQPSKTLPWPAPCEESRDVVALLHGSARAQITISAARRLSPKLR